MKVLVNSKRMALLPQIHLPGQISLQLKSPEPAFLVQRCPFEASVLSLASAVTDMHKLQQGSGASRDTAHIAPPVMLGFSAGSKLSDLTRSKCRTPWHGFRHISHFP